MTGLYRSAFSTKLGQVYLQAWQHLDTTLVGWGFLTAVKVCCI